MATIAAQAATTNAALTYAAATAGGDTIAGGSAQRTTLFVRNAGGASITTTLTAVNACSQGFLHNVVVTCAIGDTEIALPAAAQSAAGNYGLTYSAVTSVTVAAVNT
jgi:hypothetical protein